MTRKENPLEELEKAYAQWESLSRKEKIIESYW